MYIYIYIYILTTPQFHIFPKVHETNIPGRPAVSLVECHTS